MLMSDIFILRCYGCLVFISNSTPNGLEESELVVLCYCNMTMVLQRGASVQFVCEGSPDSGQFLSSSSQGIVHRI